MHLKLIKYMYILFVVIDKYSKHYPKKILFTPLLQLFEMDKTQTAKKFQKMFTIFQIFQIPYVVTVKIIKNFNFFQNLVSKLKYQQFSFLSNFFFNEFFHDQRFGKIRNHPSNLFFKLLLINYVKLLG